MIEVVQERAAGRWLLVSHRGLGADVLAHCGKPAGGRGGDPPRDWRRAVQQLYDGAGELTVRTTGDGHFQWILTDADRRPIADSPAVYRTEDGCRRAFAAARRAAATALGAGREPIALPTMSDLLEDRHETALH
jgi:hypothetical protein